MGRVEPGQILQAGLVGQVVQRDDLDARIGASLDQGAQDAAADAAVTIECNLVGARWVHE